MTADELVEKLVEIDRPEYEILVYPRTVETDEGFELQFEPKGVYEIIDVRRRDGLGGVIEVVVE